MIADPYRPLEVRFSWREKDISKGGGIRLRDEDGQDVAGFITDNPAWCIYDGKDFTNIFSGNGYDIWTDVRLIFDWATGEIRYHITDGTTTKTGQVTMANSRKNITELAIVNQNGLRLFAGTAMYMWIDNLELVYPSSNGEGRVWTHRFDTNVWNLIDSAFQIQTGTTKSGRYAMGIEADKTRFVDVAVLPIDTVFQIGTLDSAGLAQQDVAVAYAMRRLFGSYEGPQVRVQRSSDGEAKDVFFDRYGEQPSVDDTDLSTWLEGATAQVTEWYDQGPHSNNLQVLGDPPPLVQYDGKYAIEFNGSAYLKEKLKIKYMKNAGPYVGAVLTFQYDGSDNLNEEIPRLSMFNSSTFAASLSCVEHYDRGNFMTYLYANGVHKNDGPNVTGGSVFTDQMYQVFTNWRDDSDSKLTANNLTGGFDLSPTYLNNTPGTRSSDITNGTLTSNFDAIPSQSEIRDFDSILVGESAQNQYNLDYEFDTKYNPTATWKFPHGYLSDIIVFNQDPPSSKRKAIFNTMHRTL